MKKNNEKETEKNRKEKNSDLSLSQPTSTSSSSSSSTSTSLFENDKIGNILFDEEKQKMVKSEITELTQKTFEQMELDRIIEKIKIEEEIKLIEIQSFRDSLDPVGKR